jgi:D-amino-acid dehydrogenase
MKTAGDVIIGAGVIGLHIAYYLQKQGRQVVIIDHDTADNNCSFGNAGYISPSHFIPLATPGIVWQGLKWMLDATSPFYIKPRFNKNLLRWGYYFWKSANKKTVQTNAPHLFRLLSLSRSLTIDIYQETGCSFGLKEDGCFMLYTEKETEKHEKDLAREARASYGMDVPVYSREELLAYEPLISKHVLGGAFYKMDCHLHPGLMMAALKKHLQDNGVQFVFGEKIRSFTKSDGKVVQVEGQHRSFPAENLFIAAGSWSQQVAGQLGIDILLEAGKGYSYTYKNPEKNIHHPAILVDHRVAMTPLGQDLRVGGTMELAGLDLGISRKRIPPVVRAANRYFDRLFLPVPPAEEVWSGLRPVSPDGLPYIGRDEKYRNVYVGCGHAMIGISSAAATGYLLSQLATGQKPEIEMQAFSVNRF